MRTNAIAALAILVLVACYRQEDAVPRLVSVDLTGVAADGVATPRSRIDIRVSGTELWRRDVAIAVEQTSARGVVKTLETLPAQFDEASPMQTAMTSWTVDGEVLLEPGRSTILFRAIYEAQMIDSSPVFVEVDPRLDSVMLIGHTSGEHVQPGMTISARIIGRDVWSRELDVDVVRRPEQGALETLETQKVAFDAAEGMQSADVSWVIAGDFLERAGSNDIFFRARLLEQSLSSDPVIVDIRSGVTAIRLFHELRGVKTPLAPQAAVPAAGRLVLEADGAGLVGQRATIAVLRQGTMVELDSSMFTVNENRLDAAFSLEGLDFGADDSIVVFFRISVGSLLADSPVVRIDRAGFLGCSWLGSAGAGAGPPFDDRFVIASGTDVVLRAETFGLDGMMGAFEIWESDGAAGSDFVARLRTATSSAAADAQWTAVYLDDGVLQMEAEYYFTADIGGHSCRSPILVVRE